MNRLISGAVAAVLIFSSVSYAATTSTDTVTSATAETTAVTAAPKATTIVAPKATTTAPKAAATAPKTTTAAPKATTTAAPKTTTAPKTATPVKTTTAPVKAAAAAAPAPAAQTKTYEDGTYRGIFLDTNELQVNVDFQLKDNKVASIKYRWLAYKGKDYKNEKEDQKIIDMTKQYTALITHLVEKDIRTAVKELYKPGDIVKEKTIDGMTGATLKSGKVISAINDALNRGVYSYPK